MRSDRERYIPIQRDSTPKNFFSSDSNVPVSSAEEIQPRFLHVADRSGTYYRCARRSIRSRQPPQRTDDTANPTKPLFGRCFQKRQPTPSPCQR